MCFTAKFNEWLIKIGHWGIHTAIKINRMNEEKKIPKGIQTVTHLVKRI